MLKFNGTIAEAHSLATDEYWSPLFDFGTVLSFVIILGIVFVQSLILSSYRRCLAAVGMFKSIWYLSLVLYCGQ